MGENGLTLFCILFLSFEVIILILDYIRLHKEFHLPESVTGKVSFKLHRTPFYWLGVGIAVAVGFGAVIYVCSDGLTSTNQLVFYFILFLGAIFEMILLDLKPEKVFENGILHRREGFVSWIELEIVIDSNSKHDQIYMKRKGFECDNLTLHCMPGMAGGVVEYIQKQISDCSFRNIYNVENERGIINFYKRSRINLLKRGILPWIRYFSLLGCNMASGYLIYHSFF